MREAIDACYAIRMTYYDNAEIPNMAWKWMQRETRKNGRITLNELLSYFGKPTVNQGDILGWTDDINVLQCGFGCSWNVGKGRYFLSLPPMKKFDIEENVETKIDSKIANIHSQICNHRFETSKQVLDICTWMQKVEKAEGYVTIKRLSILLNLWAVSETPKANNWGWTDISTIIQYTNYGIQRQGNGYWNLKLPSPKRLTVSENEQRYFFTSREDTERAALFLVHRINIFGFASIFDLWIYLNDFEDKDPRDINYGWKGTVHFRVEPTCDGVGYYLVWPAVQKLERSI